jgi:hypothetical protein
MILELTGADTVAFRHHFVDRGQFLGGAPGHYGWIVAAVMYSPSIPWAQTMYRSGQA